MNKNGIVLLGSPRRHGNTERLVDEWIRGANDMGNQIDKIVIRDKNIKECLGCGACQKNGGICIQKDDMQEIYEEMLDAEIIVFASPVYFYTWTSLMKKAIDRTFAIERLLHHKKFYLISAGAAPEEKYMKTMLDCYHQYISCFRAPGNEDGGFVIGYGTNLPTDVENSPAMKQAYELGKNI